MKNINKNNSFKLILFGILVVIIGVINVYYINKNFEYNDQASAIGTQKALVEGIFEYRWIHNQQNGEEGTSEHGEHAAVPLYTLRTIGKNSKTHNVRFTIPSEAPFVISGSKVRIRGEMIGNTIIIDPEKTEFKFPQKSKTKKNRKNKKEKNGTEKGAAVANAQTGGSLFQVINEPASGGTLGAQSVGTALVMLPKNTTDLKDSSLWHKLVFTDFADFIRRDSLGKAWVSGTTMDWTLIPPENAQDISTQLDYLKTQGYDFDTYYNRLVYVINGTSGGWGGGNKSRGTAAPCSERSLQCLSHEFGHAMGLGHADMLYCGTTPLLRDISKCTPYEYSGLGIMGIYHKVSYNVVDKLELGWITPKNISISGTYPLSRFDAPSGNHTLIIPLHNDNKRYTFYLEYRPEGVYVLFDMWGALQDQGRSLVGYNHTYTLNMHPTTDPISALPSVWALKTGETFNDPISGTKITFVSGDTSYAQIKVEHPNDTQAPVFQSVSIPNNSKVSGTIEVDPIITDNVGIKKIEIYENNILKSTSEFSEPFKINTHAYTNGNHTFKFKAYDFSQNVAELSITYNVSNETTPPVITLYSPQDNATVRDYIEIRHGATDNVKVVNNEYLIDGKLMASQEEAIFGISWNTKEVPNGQHTITLRSIDSSDNVTERNIVVNVSNTTGTVPPRLAMTLPAPGSIITDSATVSVDTYDHEGVQKVVFELDGNVLVEKTSAPYTHTFSTSAISPGIHTLKATSYDILGNRNSLSRKISVRQNDTTPPVISFDSPRMGGGIADTSHIIRVSASDNLNVSRIELYINDAFVGRTTRNDSLSILKTADEIFGQGNQAKISVTALDSHGNQSTLTNMVTKGIVAEPPVVPPPPPPPPSPPPVTPLPPPTPILPRVTVISPNGGETLSRDVAFTVSYSISNSPSRPQIYLERYYPPGDANTGAAGSIRLYGGGINYSTSTRVIIGDLSAIPPGIGGYYKYKIKVCIEDCKYSDTSDSFITITPIDSEILLTNPNSNIPTSGPQRPSTSPTPVLVPIPLPSPSPTLVPTVPAATLNINITKIGMGTVTGILASTSGVVINCGSDCGETFTSSKIVNLTARPSAGYKFTSWSATTCSTSTKCSVNVSSNISVTARFDPI